MCNTGLTIAQVLEIIDAAIEDNKRSLWIPMSDSQNDACNEHNTAVEEAVEALQAVRDEIVRMDALLRTKLI